MTAPSPRALPTDAVAPGLPLATAAFSALRPSPPTPAPPAPSPPAPAAAQAGPSGSTLGEATVAWRFPALPASLADAARAAFGVTLIADDAAEDPLDSPAFATLYAHARAEQIVRALARRTNLVLPAARVLVVGDGPVAEVIASILGRGGSRVVRGITDPVARLCAHLAGTRTATPPWPAADLVITTGEAAHPLSRSATGNSPVPEIAIHAPRTAHEATSVGTGTGTVRPFVSATGAESWAVEVPDVFTAGDGASARIADALIALSILRAVAPDATAPDATAQNSTAPDTSDSTGSPSDPDTRLAELVLA